MRATIITALQHLLGQQHQRQRLKETEHTDKEAGSVLGAALGSLIVKRRVLLVGEHKEQH